MTGSEPPLGPPTGRDRSPVALPAFHGGLTGRRRIAGFALALAGGPLLTWPLRAFHTPDAITTEVLSYQLLVVIVALVGGIWPALFAAVLSGFTIDLLFIEPRHAVDIADPRHLLALLLHVSIAALVSFVVDRAARQTHAARRAAAEAELLQAVAESVLRGEDAVQALVDRTREAFSLTGLRLVENGAVVAESGEPPAVGRTWRAPVADGAVLELAGPALAAPERRLLAAITAQLAAALQRRSLEETASEIEPIAASDRVRGALLSALSHDLRRPLAAATTAVGGLRSAAGSLSPEDTDELLETADESLRALSALVTDLLDVSRVQAGVLTITTVPVDPAEAVVPALDELGLGPGEVELDLRHGAARALADPVLLQRALVNLLANAQRHAPPGSRVRIATRTTGDRVEIRIIDRGPGIPPERRDDVFVPFQRLGDTDNSAGLGLGLALSRGFVEGMRGTLRPEETPEGGLTMVIGLLAHAETARTAPGAAGTEGASAAQDPPPDPAPRRAPADSAPQEETP